VTGCASHSSVEPISRKSAIHATAIQAEQAPELQRCLKHWSVLQVERRGLELFNADSDQTGKVLLEVGNSGFMRYNYVYVEGTFLRSSSGKEKDISRSELGGLLKDLFEHNLQGLKKNDSSIKSDDDDCYFLSFTDGITSTAIASYGIPDTDAGKLIQALIAEAR